MSTRQPEVVRVEQVGVLASLRRFAYGYLRSKWWIVVTLIGAGLLIGNGTSEHAPVAARRAQLEAKRQAVLVQEYEAEQWQPLPSYRP